MVGEIVWAPFPFTDLRGAKIRPVLIVADVREPREDDWVVCEITSSAMARGQTIPIAPSDMVSGQLSQVSVARPGRLITLNRSVFRSTIGRVTAAKQAQVAAAIRSQF